MPAWVNSDHLTLLGFVAMFAAGLLYWAASVDCRALLGVIVALAVNWFGDSLDGTLARVRQRQRPRYGFYVDHITDAIGTFFLMGGLALSGYMNPFIALGLLVVYLLLSIEVYLTTYTIGSFHLSFWSFGPTELRLLLCVGNIALYVPVPWCKMLGRDYRIFDVGGVIGIAGMGADADLVRRAAHAAAVRRRAPAVKALAFRWLKFNFVGASESRCNLARFGSSSRLHLHYLVATALAVELAVLHNFVWHERFTWKDRAGGPWRAVVRRLLRFHAGNGLVSLLGNLALMRLFVGVMHLEYMVANVLTIAHLFAFELRRRRMVCLSAKSD